MDNLKATSPSPEILMFLCSVPNIIKRFTAHGTVANLPGCGRKSKINGKITMKDSLNGG